MRTRRLTDFCVCCLIITGMALPYPSLHAEETVELKNRKPLASWDSVQMRIREDDKWRDRRFGTLEVYPAGLLHRGRETTLIAWERVESIRLHPLAHRVMMALKNPGQRLELETMLSWSRYDFEMMFRDLVRFRDELGFKKKIDTANSSAAGNDALPPENRDRNGG
ncbi:MAG: hypothetical protein JXA62_01535 [Candidatus Aminicenantes bacterium]|nr:hypothetical protein [Candidatus Aminicenantes bacterium]